MQQVPSIVDLEFINVELKLYLYILVISLQHKIYPYICAINFSKVL